MFASSRTPHPGPSELARAGLADQRGLQTSPSPQPSCPFCAEHLEQSTSPFDITLAQTDAARLLPALGTLTPGYLLVSSSEHVPSMADLDLDTLRTIISWTSAISGRLAVEFGEYLLFEHGSCHSQPSGACINHAHIHLVPLARELGPILLRSAPWRRVETVEEVVLYKRCSYLHLTINEQSWILPNPTLGSQWLRRKIGDLLRTELWDWALDPGIDFYNETIARLERESLLSQVQHCSNRVEST